MAVHECLPSLASFPPVAPVMHGDSDTPAQHVECCRNLSSGFSAVLCRNLRLLEFKAACTEPRAMQVIKMSSCL